MSKQTKLKGLPFVGKARDTKKRSFWTIPAEGNYVDGTKIGMTMATAYLAYIADSSGLSPVLPQVVMDMIASDLSDSLHGQVIGFFSIVEQAVARRTADQKMETTKLAGKSKNSGKNKNRSPKNSA